MKIILTDILGMSKALARWVRRMLTEEQKLTPLAISRYLMSCYEDYLNRHLRYVEGFGKMGEANVDRGAEIDSARYF